MVTPWCVICAVQVGDTSRYLPVSGKHFSGPLSVLSRRADPDSGVSQERRSQIKIDKRDNEIINIRTVL